jgi:hypothetical protein
VHYYRARIEALLGHRNRAIRSLREAYPQGFAHSTRVDRDPDFEVVLFDGFENGDTGVWANTVTSDP